MYIIKKTLEVDALTGLDKELWLTSVNIDAENKVITVTGYVCLVSPTGICMEKKEIVEYTRYNSPTKNKYDQLEQSTVGAGIKALLQLDINLYPDFIQTL